jgi:hypothetical protein
MFTELFQSELLPGETLLWTGQPSQHVIFHKYDAYFVPISLFVAYQAGLWLAVDLHLLGPSSYRDMPRDSSAFAVDVIFCLVALYLVLGRFFTLRWKKRHIYYAVTDRRVLILHDYRGRKLRSIPWAEIPSVRKTLRDDGIGTLRFSKPRDPGDWLHPAVRMDEFRKSGAPTFADIESAEQVFQLLSTQRDRATNPA